MEEKDFKILTKLFLVITVVIILANSGCELDKITYPSGKVVVENVYAEDPGYCEVVISVTNTGKDPISQVDFVVVLETDTRPYHQRVVDSNVIPPGKTVGIVETVTFETPDEVSQKETVKIKWSSFS